MCVCACVLRCAWALNFDGRLCCVWVDRFGHPGHDGRHGSTATAPSQPVQGLHHDQGRTPALLPPRQVRECSSSTPPSSMMMMRFSPCLRVPSCVCLGVPVSCLVVSCLCLGAHKDDAPLLLAGCHDSNASTHASIPILSIPSTRMTEATRALLAESREGIEARIREKVGDPCMQPLHAVVV